MKRALFSLFFALLAMGATVVALLLREYSRWGELIWLLPLGVIVVYGGGCGLYYHLKPWRRDREKLSHLADEMYFLGYLCTISSLATLVIAGMVLKSQLSPESFLRGAGIGLTTTVLGLVMMLAFRSLAASTAPGAVSSEKMEAISVLTEGVQNALREELDGVLATLKAISKLKGEVDTASAKFKTLNGNLGTTNNEVGKFNKSVEDGRKSVDRFVAGVGVLHKGLTDLGETGSEQTVQRIKKAVEAMGELTQSYEGVKAAADGLSISINTLSTDTKDLSTPVKASTKDMEAFDEEAKEVRQVLVDFVKLVEKMVPHIRPGEKQA